MKPDALFTLFGKGVYLYGICIAVGILCCIFVLFYYTKKKGMPEKVQDFVFIVGIIAIAIGFIAAKFYQALYVWIETGEFDFYNAGLTVMGGLIGGAASFIGVYFLLGKFVFKGKEKGLHVKNFNMIVQVAPICITIAHAFGRLGCLFGGCCHGTYLGSDPVAGGIYMRGTVNDMSRWGYYVPTQLYESLFLFALFGVLTYMFFNRSNITMHVYLIGYGVWRIIIELFRGDAARIENLAGGLTPSQWQSIVFILGGIALLVIYKLMKWPYFYPKESTGDSDKVVQTENK